MIAHVDPLLASLQCDVCRTECSGAQDAHTGTSKMSERAAEGLLRFKENQGEVRDVRKCHDVNCECELAGPGVEVHQWSHSMNVDCFRKQQGCMQNGGCDEDGRQPHMPPSDHPHEHFKGDEYNAAQQHVEKKFLWVQADFCILCQRPTALQKQWSPGDSSTLSHVDLNPFPCKNQWLQDPLAEFGASVSLTGAAIRLKAFPTTNS
jgi:hypothetical protein